ncbi:MAG: DUF2304 domain-containing protein [Victivallales bacterium]|nr:DUF2304 domain-containing protein [Victivallales bacterium]
MSIIQFIILAFLLLSFAMVLLVIRRNVFGRLFFMAQFVVGALFVVFPDLSTKVAHCIGVGRGTDLLLYFLIVLFYMTVLCFIAAIRRIERRQTAIIRQMAIQSAISNESCK